MFNYPALISLTSLYLFLNLTLFTSVHAQTNTCDCNATLNELNIKVRNNYPGYSIKITSANEANFKRFTDSLKKSADTANFISCFHILQKWMGYFKDKHLVLALKEGPQSSDFIRSIFKDSYSYHISKDSLLERWQKAPDYPLEGIWNTGGLYEVAVLKKNNRYLGIVTKGDNIFWTPGQIKFELQRETEFNWRVIFYNRYHEKDTFTTYIDENTYLLDLKSSKWEKTYPIRPHQLTVIPADSFYCAKPDSNNVVLRLPGFDLQYKPLIDSLIKSNFHTITHTPHLIIDVRGNMGGFNLSFEELLPLLYTDTIVSHGAYIMATDDNIKLYEDLLKNDQYPNESKQQTINLIKNLKMHRNGYYLTPDVITTFPQVQEFPAKVGILMDEGSGSATEFLILAAKQSKKVTLFGKRSTGAVDYLNLVSPRSMACSQYMLWCPTARSARLPQHPIDNTGIIPDVEIPNQVNWINFVQQYLAKQEKTIATSSK